METTSNRINSLVTLVSTLSLAILTTTVSALATTILDPVEGRSPDIVSLTATYDSAYLYLSADFNPGTFDSSHVGLNLGIDTDLNLSTGADNTGRFFPIGAEYSINYTSTAITEPGRFRLSQWDTPDTTVVVGYLTPQFATNGFELAIPLAVIGNSGAVNFGLAAGNPTTDRFFTGVDYVSGHGGVAPNVTLVGPSDFGTPQWTYDPNFTAVPEPSATSLLALGAFGGFIGRRLHRRTHPNRGP